MRRPLNHESLMRKQVMNTTPQPRPLCVLGIESSCDDTAAALVQMQDMQGEILAQSVLGQSGLHEKFGGVVPEIAARAHAERLDDAVAELGVELDSVDLIAVTTGPGLIGGLMAANGFARALSLSLGKPLIGVNHLAGHALTPCLTDGLEPPYLMLLVSGGHCQFLAVKDYNQFERMGSTIDDSPGEAFDKIAKILGLGYPGGPEIEREAKMGDATRFDLPRPLLNREGFDFSFSGLKTATRRVRDEFVASQGGMTRQDRADLCASFQAAVADVIAKKSALALSSFRDEIGHQDAPFAIAGGVAANATIRQELDKTLDAPIIAPPLKLCTDNAAMIAYAGGVKYQLEGVSEVDLLPRPRWPLDKNAAPLFGSGKRGAKA